jgi:hypothetical protein
MPGPSCRSQAAGGAAPTVRFSCFELWKQTRLPATTETALSNCRHSTFSTRWATHRRICLIRNVERPIILMAAW